MKKMFINVFYLGIFSKIAFSVRTTQVWVIVLQKQESIMCKSRVLTSDTWKNKQKTNGL